MRRMNIFLVIISNVFASEQKKCGKNIAEVCDHQAENVQVKIEEEKHDKNTPNFSKPDSEVSEEVQQNECTKSCVQLCESTIANVMVKIEEDEGVKKQTSSKYFGVSWDKDKEKWKVRRRSKAQGKIVYNGSFNYDEEAKAAHASDTLARNLINKGEGRHKLNFPNDDIEVWTKEKETSSKYFGVTWNKNRERWQVSRRSKTQGKLVCNGYFNRDEETKAAHASDTLARKLMNKGEEVHKLNYPNDDTEVWAERNKKRKRTDRLEPQND